MSSSSFQEILNPFESSTIDESVPLRESDWHVSAVPNEYIDKYPQSSFDSVTLKKSSVKNISNSLIKDSRPEHFNDYQRTGIINTISCLSFKCGCIICLILLILAVAFVTAYPVFSSTSPNMVELSARKQNLTTFNLTSPLMTLDSENYLLILSQQDHTRTAMIVQRFPLNSAQTGFRESVVPLPKWMHQCQQYFDDVFCCFPDRLPKSEIHCDMQDGQDPWVAPGNFWQTLQVDGTMVVQHFAEYNILDTKKRLIYPVKFDEKPLDLRPASFFFPMENIMDLTEIAIRDDRFFLICEYVKLNIQQFRLVGDTDEKCHKTSFIKKDGMRGLRFCTNPIYHAIIQYDTLRPREHLYMQWQLQVSYREDDRKIYKYDAVNISPSGQIVMECNITEINVYVTGDGVLLKYVISLPKSDLKSLLGNSF